MNEKAERYRVPSTGTEINVPADDVDAQTTALLAHPEMQTRAARARRRRAVGERGVSAEELYAEFGTPPAVERDTAQRAAAGRLLLRLPRSLHAQLADLAKAEGISLNQYVLSLLAQGVGRPETRWHDAHCVVRNQHSFQCRWRALPSPHISDIFDRIQIHGECPRKIAWSEGDTVSGVTVNGIITTSRFRVELFRPIDDERCEILFEEKSSSLLSQLLLDQSDRPLAATQ